jgi:acetyl esterase/lipase
MPGTAYVNLNTVNADVIYPGLLSHLPSDTQIIVAIFPNAPENKFPTPVAHLQRTISELLEQPQKYLIDESNVILGGYSCGATMTIPLATYFAKQSLFFKSLLLVSPIFDYSG